MFKCILVLVSLFIGANSFAAGEVLTDECLQRVAAQASLVKKSAVAVIKGQNVSHYKTNMQIPVDVQVFNDAHDLLASLPHLAEPQVLEERQLMILAAVCGGPSFEAEVVGAILESLPVPF